MNDVKYRMTIHWQWLFALVVFELWLIYSIPNYPLTDHATLRLLVDFINSFASVVSNFDRIVEFPEKLRLYFAISIVLVIPKTLFFYFWLNSNRLANYRHFVSSPLTAFKPKTPTDFAASSDKVGTSEEKHSSMRDRIAWSIGILFFSFLAVVYLLNYGFEVSRGLTTGLSSYRSVVRGDWTLWLAWSVVRTMFCGLVFAAMACVIRDYLSALKKLT